MIGGGAGEVYNISGMNVYKISEIVDILRKNTVLDLETEVDEKLLRPSDEKLICGDSSKLIEQTGWKQKYSLEMTIKDMLEYQRRRL